MSKLIRESEVFHEEIHQLERSQAVDKEIANIQPQKLLDNDHYLRDRIDAGDQDLIDHQNNDDNPHLVTHDQTSPDGVATGTDAERNKHISDADYTRWEDHRNAKNNPHNVTTGQIGAVDESVFDDHLGDYTNPHKVTRAQLGAASNPHGNDQHTTNYLAQTGGTVSGDIIIGRNATLRKVIQSSGSTVTIVDLAGRVHFAVYNDLAEFFPAAEAVEPGDVVVWTKNGVRACEGAAHTGVVGVVSDSFGPVLGGDPDLNVEETIQSGRFAPVALTGRVWVKAVGPIQPFDLLEASTVKGHARKNTSRGQSGEVGTIVGKALEGLDEGETKRICMLVMLR